MLLTRLDAGDGTRDLEDDLSIFSLASFASVIVCIRMLGCIYQWSGQNSLELMATFFRVLFALSVCTVITVIINDNFDAKSLTISMAFHAAFFVLEGLFWERSDVGKRWIRAITAMKRCKNSSLAHSNRAPLLMASRERLQGKSGEERENETKEAMGDGSSLDRDNAC